MKQTISN